jgi:hypothetical protein
MNPNMRTIRAARRSRNVTARAGTGRLGTPCNAQSQGLSQWHFATFDMRMAKTAVVSEIFGIEKGIRGTWTRIVCDRDGAARSGVSSRMGGWPQRAPSFLLCPASASDRRSLRVRDQRHALAAPTLEFQPGRDPARQQSAAHTTQEVVGRDRIRRVRPALQMNLILILSSSALEPVIHRLSWLH